jgi:hypothetical protein
MIKFSVRGLDEVKKYMAALPRGVKITAMEAIATYLIGNEQHGLAKAPERVNHGEGNPYEWQSEKQRRAYFATDGFGAGIPYKRTGNLSAGWVYEKSDSNWTSVKIENIESYAGFVMGNEQQRGHAADKWRQFADVISTNLTGALHYAQQKVDQWIKQHG